MNKNFWGESNDDEPLPEWMNPKTYSNPRPPRHTKSLNEAIQEALRKPAVPVSLNSEYEIATLQEAEEFAQKRNYDYTGNGTAGREAEAKLKEKNT